MRNDADGERNEGPREMSGIGVVEVEVEKTVDCFVSRCTSFKMASRKKRSECDFDPLNIVTLG